MRGKEQYQQGALRFDAKPNAVPGHPTLPDTTGSAPIMPKRPRYPTHDELMESRYQHNLWAEYRFECENRERLDLPYVGLDEFEDMRDWSDGMLEPPDVACPRVPTQPAYASRTRQQKVLRHF